MPEEKSQEQELVEVLKRLIASVPGEGQMAKGMLPCDGVGARGGAVTPAV